MKKLIPTILLALCTIGVFASTNQKFLVIEADNGDKTYFQEGKAKSFYYEDASFEIDPSSVTVVKGATQQLQAKFNAAEVSASWVSSAEGIATVNGNGIVTGVADGEATITATYNGASAVSVVMVKSLMVDPATTDLLKGQTTNLTAKVGDETVVASWSSSAEGVATVDAATGKVTAVGDGQATITATYKGVVATGVINVNSLIIDPAAAEVLVGHSITLNAKDGDEVVAASWISDHTDVVTVNAATGEVTGVSNGVATITATYDGATATSVITVNDLVVEPATVDVFIGLNKTLVAKVAGSEVVASWTSSNSGVASVNASTGVVTGESVGTATITATYEGVTATSVITVKVGSVEMVFVEKGTFEMGSPDDVGEEDEHPKHTVTFTQDFYIGKYEVTQKLWTEVMESNPSNFNTNELNPVEKVTWYDCIEFCNALSERDGYDKVYNIDKVNEDPNNTSPSDDIKWTVTINANASGYRLPTEAQWEYASKGGHLSQSKAEVGASDYIYSGSDGIDNVAWYRDNSAVDGTRQTHQVGTKSANELGIHDMSGNVWEWCFDWYGDYTSSQTDPGGPVQGNFRVIRGGSYNHDDYHCRSAYRYFSNSYYGLINYGLRVVRVLP